MGLPYPISQPPTEIQAIEETITIAIDDLEFG